MKTKRITTAALTLVAGCLVASASLLAADALPSGYKSQIVHPKVEEDGTVHVPAFDLPLSSFLSPEAKASINAQLHGPVRPSSADKFDIVTVRKAFDEVLAPTIAKLNQQYAVTMEEKTIAGIYTQVFTPKDGVAEKNKHRVLINLHGGSFLMGARTQSQVESIPVAALGKIKVISVDYREAPEYKFPAASEDVAAIYRELLKTYKPTQIGIYGCSAGGELSGQSMAWFQKEHLPNPAGIGILCAGLHADIGGDSNYYVSALNGTPPGVPATVAHGYFEGTSPTDPLFAPAASKDVLKKFPPTFFVTGTRDIAMGAAIGSHLDLVNAGVDAELYVWDGTGHAFFTVDPFLPESIQVVNVIVNFFDKHMSK